MVWIHDETCFNEKYIRQKAEENGFSEPLNVERFLWDCEIASQLHSESDCFILKGGAAVQLHLPLEKQRGSIDVDVICATTKATIEKAVSNIEKRIGDIKFESLYSQKPYNRIKLIDLFCKDSSISLR